MKRKNQALTLGEILLALALMSIVLVSATLTLQWALRGNIEQRNQTEAAFIAQKVTEKLCDAGRRCVANKQAQLLSSLRY